MAHKSNWFKICGVVKGSDCYNCANRLSIAEEKDRVIVRCKPKNLNGERILIFDRRTSPDPYCGAYLKGETDGENSQKHRV